MLILRQLNNKLKQLLDCRTNVMRANNESHSFWNLLLLWFRVHACNTWVNLTLGGLKNDLAGHYSQVMIQFYQTSRITVTLRVPGQITMYGAKIYQYIIIYHTGIQNISIFATDGTPPSTFLYCTVLTVDVAKSKK